MPSLEQIGTELGKLVQAKNQAYGDSWRKTGAFLKLLYPTGIPVEKYQDALILVRIFDKMMRVATDRQAFGETPYWDIGGYAILGVLLHDERETSPQEKT